jgi:hypothetical protein
MNLKDDTVIWWKLLNYDKMLAFSNEEYEKVFLDK